MSDPVNPFDFGKRASLGMNGADRRAAAARARANGTSPKLVDIYGNPLTPPPDHEIAAGICAHIATLFRGARVDIAAELPAMREALLKRCEDPPTDAELKLVEANMRGAEIVAEFQADLVVEMHETMVDLGLEEEDDERPEADEEGDA